MSFAIGKREVGNGRCFIIGEVGLAHDGSLRAANAFIDAIAAAGCDAVKFQHHLPEYEPNQPLRVPSLWDKDRQGLWERTAFSPIQWQTLALNASDAGLEFLCSPFSVESVEFLDQLVPAWKVPSGEITNEPLLEAITATGKPVLLSTGMSDHQEIGSVVNRTYAGERAVFYGSDLAILQCVSSYPSAPESVGLNVMVQLRHYGVPVGLSDHSGTIYAGLAAVTMGCDVLEVHVKLSEWDQGPDASSSLTPEKLKELVEGVRWIERAKAHPVDKDAMAKELEPMRKLFMKAEATACVR